MVRSTDRNARLMLAIDAASLLSARSTHRPPFASRLFNCFSESFNVFQCFSMLSMFFHVFLLISVSFFCECAKNLARVYMNGIRSRAHA